MILKYFLFLWFGFSVIFWSHGLLKLDHEEGENDSDTDGLKGKCTMQCSFLVYKNILAEMKSQILKIPNIITL